MGSQAAYVIVKLNVTGVGLNFQHENSSLHFKILCSLTVQALEMLTAVTILAGPPGELRTVHSYVES